MPDSTSDENLPKPATRPGREMRANEGMAEPATPGIHQPPRERFRRCDRLRTSLDFKRVYDGKCRAGDGVLLIFALPNDLGHPRLGLSVSRKVGNAVRRGRWKRLIREAFRRNRSDLPKNLDFIVIPRPGVTPELAAVRASLLRLGRQLERKLNARRGNSRQGNNRTAARHSQRRKRDGRTP